MFCNQRCSDCIKLRNFTSSEISAISFKPRARIPMERPLLNKTNWINLIGHWLGGTVISETISGKEAHPTRRKAILVSRLNVKTQLLRIFATIFNQLAAIGIIAQRGAASKCAIRVRYFWLALHWRTNIKLQDVVCKNILRESYDAWNSTFPIELFVRPIYCKWMELDQAFSAELHSMLIICWQHCMSFLQG